MLDNLPDNIEMYGLTIPENTITAIIRYVLNKAKPGGFLTAVFCNDLFLAVGKADMHNLKALPAIVAYIYNYCPSACHGSQADVNHWLNS